MATRNNNRNSPPNRSPVHGSVPGNLIKLFATVKQAALVIEAPVPTWSEVEVKALLTDLPQDSKAKFSLFVEQFANLGSLMHGKIAALEASRVNLKGDQEALQVERAEARSAPLLVQK